MKSARATLPGGVGLWAGFRGRLPSYEAIAAVRDFDGVGVTTLWPPERSVVNPFGRTIFGDVARADIGEVRSA